MANISSDVSGIIDSVAALLNEILSTVAGLLG